MQKSKSAACKEKGLTWVQENCGCGPASPEIKTDNRMGYS